MAIDYAQTISYILANQKVLTNPDFLNAYTSNDLIMLRQTLDLIKTQISRQIVTKALLDNSESFGPQIEAAKSVLELRLTTLSSQQQNLQSQATYPEFNAPAEIEGVPSHLQSAVKEEKQQNYDKQRQDWETHKKPYLDKQISRLKNQIDNLSRLQGYLADPEKFVMSFLVVQNVFPDLQKSDTYNSLVKDCALTLAVGRNSPEQNSSGLTEQERNDLGPLFTASQSNRTTTYTLNPQALSVFLSRIRNSDLISELDNYYQNYVSPTSHNQAIRSAQGSLDKAQSIKDALDDTETCKSVEEFLAQMQEYCETYRTTMDDQHSLNALKMPDDTRNPFKKLWYATFGRGAVERAEEDFRKKRDTLTQTAQKTRQDSRELLSKHYQQLEQKDSPYAQAYNAYLTASNTLTQKHNQRSQTCYKPQDPRCFYTLLDSLSMDYRGRENFADLLHLAVTSTEEKPLHTTVTDTLNIDQTLKSRQAEVSRLNQATPQIEARNAQLFEDLSDEAKFLVDSGIDSKGLKSRFVDFTADKQNYCTPFVSSLVLEALLKLGEVDQLQQDFNITLTDKEVTQYAKLNPQQLLQRMTFALENIINPQTQDTGR